MREDGCWCFSLDQSLVSLPDVVNMGKYLLDLKEEHYYWLPEIRRLGIWLGDLSHCWKINLGTTRNQPRHTKKQRCISFQGLPQQITKNCVTWNNRNLFSHGPGGQKPQINMSSGFIPSEGAERVFIARLSQHLRDIGHPGIPDL